MNFRLALIATIRYRGSSLIASLKLRREKSPRAGAGNRPNIFRIRSQVTSKTLHLTRIKHAIAYTIADWAIEGWRYGLRTAIGAFFIGEDDHIGDLSMENALFPELRDIPTPREYRIRNGKIEARILDGEAAQDRRWMEVSSDQLSSHVLRNTAVARWLERNLGWRRLLRACVGLDSYEHASYKPASNQIDRERSDRMAMFS
jgi:hypothetical protein